MSEEFPETIGPYKVLRELGRGAMGTVYLARQESLSRDLAIKVLAAEFTRDQEFVARFRREGLISSKLRHPHIVQVFDYSAQDNLYYIAMEYVGPEDLQAYLRANNGRLPLAEAVRLMGQVLSALECAHEAGVTHRDVKPANVLMSPRQDAVLTDFSIANMQEAQRLTQTGAMMGTPDYMAPEQFDAKQVDKRSDLYSVGVVLYEMVTGERPFPGDTVVQVMKAQLMHVPEAPHKLDPNVPEALSLAIMKALEKQPQSRWGSAAEMREAIYAALGTAPPVEAPRPSPPPPPVSLAERAAAPRLTSETLAVAAPPASKKSSGTLELARQSLGEVGDDFRSGFHTLGWKNFSLNWMPRLIALEVVWFVLTQPLLGLLGKTAVAFTYADFRLIGAGLINLFFILMLAVRLIRGERLYRKLVAGAICLLAWGFWYAQYSSLSDKKFQFTAHARGYITRLVQNR
ncbi:MAG: serine/threonine protein kinase [Candidatus Eremiobacteraeota bacterium]|nr:serine/threonine protein kinase [Candidatus Eremiobacteraeota bacterium]MCW5865814.1 serine/threonine protein kinase [Candidatus Eremiobacteraeota bacterium]